MSDAEFNDDLATWLKSESGVLCVDAATLQAATTQNLFENYLTQRLRAAFSAGWDAHAKQIDEIMAEHFASMAPFIKLQAG